MDSTCTALSAPDTMWNFCPNLGAAVAMAVFFALAFVAHVVQGIYYRKWYTWVIAMGALWQTVAYIFRIISIRNPASLGDYAVWFVLILVAPLWTNGFVYMVLGRMVWNYVPDAHIFRVPGWRFGQIFVCLDVIAFVVQVAGAATASGDNLTDVQILISLHVYMAGVAVQEVFILIFLVFAIKMRTILVQQRESSSRLKSDQEVISALRLLNALFVVLALVTLRICFRLAEYANGLDSKIPNHEAYQYCLDSLPMLLAFIVLSLIHPGQFMRGKGSDLPSRKERRSNKNGTKQRGGCIRDSRDVALAKNQVTE